MFGRHVVLGRVIAKNPYAAPSAAGEIAATKQNAVFFQGSEPQLGRPPEASGEWILRVEGIDQNGKPYAQDKYVDELTYNCTEVGDEWPRT
jgi:hypothetical protein